MLVKSQVKYIQSLSQKKFRNEEGVFVAEGPKIINELLAGSEAEPVAVYAMKQWIEDNKAVIAKHGIENFHEISYQDLERISFLSTPNEALAVFKKPLFEHEINPAKSLVLVLDTIQDPGNLGTIIRCADWFGIRHIICNSGSADNFNPKVVQSTMASVVRVEVIYTDLTIFLTDHPGVPVYAAALEGQPISEFRSVNHGIIIVGNESKGISGEVLAFSTNRITIPRFGKAESLNAAVATGIILSGFRS
jgi:TrmH family RNA methyltransferase